jgi:hypothetical protein
MNVMQSSLTLTDKEALEEEAQHRMHKTGLSPRVSVAFLVIQ